VNRSALRLIALATLLFGAAAIALGRVLNLSVDESYTLYTTSGSLLDAIQRALHFEMQAPAYFALDWFWRRLDSDPVFGRVLSTLLVCTAGVVLGILGNRRIGGIWGPAMTFAVLLNPLAWWSAEEMRVYALVIALTSVLVFSFFEGFALEDNAWAQVGFGLAAAAGLYTQYYVAFFLVAGGATLLIFRRWRLLKRYALIVALAGIAFLPMVAVIPSQMAAAARDFRSAAPFPLDMSVDLRGIAVLFAPFAWLRGGGALAAVFSLATASLAFWPRPGVAVAGSLLVARIAWSLTAVAAAVFVLAQTAAHEPNNYKYFSLFVAPALVALMATFASLTSLSGKIRAANLAVAMASVVFLLDLVALEHAYSRLAKIGDWKRVATFLQPRVAAGQPILVFEADNALPLSYHYRGYGTIVPLPHQVDFQSYSLHDIALRGEEELDAALLATHSTSPVVWLVTADYCVFENGLDFHCGVIESWVHRRFTVANTTHFYGSTVRELHRAHVVVGAREQR